MNIDKNTIIAKAENLLEAPMEESLALMSIEEGKYYGMDPIAKFIWDKLSEPIQLDKLMKQILDEYDVNESLCEKDTNRFLNELLDRKMISIEK